MQLLTRLDDAAMKRAADAAREDAPAGEGGQAVAGLLMSFPGVKTVPS